MNLDWNALIEVCRALPHATEDVKWEKNLVFSIGGKMFAIFNLEPTNRVSLKSTQVGFMALTTIAGIIPAPYLARYDWISITTSDATSMQTATELVQESYQLVFNKLSVKVKKSLSIQ